MRIIKRILTVSGLTGMLAALAFAAPAFAGEGGLDRLKGVCITQGFAKVSPPIPFTGGTGGYTFTDLVFSCIGIEQAKGGVLQSVGIVVLELSSPGSYTNIICGTGKAVSTPDAAVVTGITVQQSILGTMKTDTTAEWTAIAKDLDYAVEFVALNGLLKWTDTPAQKLSIDVPKIITAGPPGNVGGYVLILPDPAKPSPPLGACTKAFQVVGALVIDWAPGNPIV